ncbi:hypothetical protein BU17DRAFT_71751 [Hysterangium stoloniferum]|nr:hypothetical protein BU17DRAFT_71751 [Hysterangium stoloniferum]
MFGWTAVIVIVVALAATSRLVLILVLVLVWAVDLILVLVLVWGSCWPDVNADRDIFSDVGLGPIPTFTPSATASANAPTAAPAKQAQAPAGQAQAQMARIASPTPTPHIARASSPITRIASPTPFFSLPTRIRLVQQDMMESLHGHVRSDSYGHVRSESYGHVVGSGTGVGGSVLPYLVERDEEGSERHEHVEAEASTAMVNEDGHGDGVPRLQKPPVGLSVRLKMRMQTKANLNVDVAQSPTIPEYPYTFPRVPPTKIKT